MFSPTNVLFMEIILLYLQYIEILLRYLQCMVIVLLYLRYGDYIAVTT
jgi:hypothetical protein